MSCVACKTKFVGVISFFALFQGLNANRLVFILKRKLLISKQVAFIDSSENRFESN